MLRCLLALLIDPSCSFVNCAVMSRQASKQTFYFLRHGITETNEFMHISLNANLADSHLHLSLALDLLLGCDGVRSAVRKAIEQSKPDGFVCTEEKKEGGYVVLDLPHPPNLEKASVHALEGGKGF
eukprot:gene39391-47951_t